MPHSLVMKNKGLLQNKPWNQKVMIFVPNWSQPTKRNCSYVAKVADYSGQKGHFMDYGAILQEAYFTEGSNMLCNFAYSFCIVWRSANKTQKHPKILDHGAWPWCVIAHAAIRNRYNPRVAEQGKY